MVPPWSEKIAGATRRTATAASCETGMLRVHPHATEKVCRRVVPISWMQADARRKEKEDFTGLSLRSSRRDITGRSFFRVPIYGENVKRRIYSSVDLPASFLRATHALISMRIRRRKVRRLPSFLLDRTASSWNTILSRRSSRCSLRRVARRWLIIVDWFRWLSTPSIKPNQWSGERYVNRLSMGRRRRETESVENRRWVNVL